MSDSSEGHSVGPGSGGSNGFKEAQRSKRWVHSPPPVEVWSEDENNSQFEVRIIGEEILPDGSSLYELLWPDWKGRPDGTKTTWATARQMEEELGVSPEFRDDWDHAQKDHRMKLARHSTEIAIQSTTEIHNTLSFLRSQAYDEKVEYHLSNPSPNWMDELQKVRTKHDARRGQGASSMDIDQSEDVQGSSLSSSPPPRTISQRSSTRLTTKTSLANTTSSNFRPPRHPSVSSTATIASSSADSLNLTSMSPSPDMHRRPHSARSSTLVAMRTPTPALVDKGKGREIIKPLSNQSQSSGSKRSRVKYEEDEPNWSPSQVEDSISVRRKPANPHTSPTPIARRTALAKAWSRIAAESGAAPITFTNDVPGDGQVLPDLPPDFRYMEAHYEFDDAVLEMVNEFRSFVSGCAPGCTSCNTADCYCHGNWDHTNEFQELYTPKFLAEIQECTAICNCSPEHCRNRVAQIPRDITIDVFKTSNNRGWGVRSPSHVQENKVLGLYTGLVMSREKAKALENSSYVYDLDEDNVQTEAKFSVDSRCEGNWTRFINHSCEPNLRVHTFVHDLPRGVGLGYVVFVAHKDIPAGTEFTLHYDPRAILPRNPKSKKKKVKGSKCLCGAQKCNGIIPFL